MSRNQEAHEPTLEESVQAKVCSAPFHCSDVDLVSEGVHHEYVSQGPMQIGTSTECWMHACSLKRVEKERGRQQNQHQTLFA